MSEIQRYAVIETALCIGGNLHEGEVLMVRADEHDRELSALREELAKYKGCCVDLGSQVREHKMDYWEGSNKALQQRLTAAEQRNAILTDALTEERRIRLLGQQPDIHWESLRDDRRACYAKTDAALAKPTESGASE